MCVGCQLIAVTHFFLISSLENFHSGKIEPSSLSISAGSSKYLKSKTKNNQCRIGSFFSSHVSAILPWMTSSQLFCMIMHSKVKPESSNLSSIVTALRLARAPLFCLFSAWYLAIFELFSISFSLKKSNFIRIKNKFQQHTVNFHVTQRPNLYFIVFSIHIENIILSHLIRKIDLLYHRRVSFRILVT